MSRPEITMLVVPIALLLYVLELVRRRRIREDYSLLWLATFGVLLLLSVFRDTLLEQLSELMGIAYPPAALFVVGFGLMLLIMLQFSIIITRLTEQNRQTAQKIALLNTRLTELEHKFEAQSEEPETESEQAD